MVNPLQGGEVPSVEDISAVTDQEILGLHSNVMGELMVCSRGERRDHWGPEEGLPGPLLAVDDEVLLGVYRAVHDEMIIRQAQRPRWLKPREDECV